MDFSATFNDALNALRRGAMNVPEVMAIAEQNRKQAAFLASHVLTDVSARALCAQSGQRGLSSDTDDGIQRVLEVVWLLDGPSKCLYGDFSMLPKPVGNRFLLRRMREHPEEFGREELLLVGRWWKDLAEEAQRMIDKRTADAASSLMKHPSELNADLAWVKQQVSRYSFGDELNELLNKVDDGIGADGDGFDHASLLKHLRTFFEKLHTNVAKRLQSARPETIDRTDLGKCQQVIDYLNRKGVLTEDMKKLGRALYGMLSNVGVHAVKARSEYVRLSRNMVTEYAMVLLLELEAATKS